MISSSCTPFNVGFPQGSLCSVLVSFLTRCDRVSTFSKLFHYCLYPDVTIVYLNSYFSDKLPTCQISPFRCPTHTSNSVCSKLKSSCLTHQSVPLTWVKNIPTDPRQNARGGFHCSSPSCPTSGQTSCPVESSTGIFLQSITATSLVQASFLLPGHHQSCPIPTHSPSDKQNLSELSKIQNRPSPIPTSNPSFPKALRMKSKFLT